jgi:hypothetical protein
MPPVKPINQFNWKKSFYWLSPLLLVSLGLHGLALLIPLPEPQTQAAKIVAERNEPEPPPSIDVATLPPNPITPSASPPKSAAPITAPTSLPAAPLAPIAPAANPPRSIAPAPNSPAPIAPAANPPTSNPPTSNPPAANPPTPSTSNGAAPNSPTPDPTKPPAIYQAFSSQGVSSGESNNALITFSTEILPLYNLTYPKEIKNTLTLTYTAGDRCFVDESTGEDYPTLESYLAVVIGNAGNQANPDEVTFLVTEILQSTGFAAVNEWVIQTVESDAKADTLEWIRTHAEDPQFDDSVTDESYMFPITIECK